MQPVKTENYTVTVTSVSLTLRHRAGDTGEVPHKRVRVRTQCAGTFGGTISRKSSLYPS